MDMIAAYLRAMRQFNRDVRLYLFVTALMGFAVFGGIYPVLFNLYLLRLGYGPKFVGLINSASMLTFAVSSLPAGLVSRVEVLGKRLGGRRTMIVGLSLAAIGYGGMCVVEFLPSTLWPVWLVANGVLRALGFALYWVNARPFLMGATAPRERYHVYSVQAAISPLAGFVGSLVGGLLPGFFSTLLDVPLEDPAPYRYPLWIAAAMLVPALLGVVAMREFGAGHAEERPSSAKNMPFGLIALLSLTVLLTAAGQGSARSFFNVYLDAGLRVPTFRIGAISALGQLLAALAALGTPPLVARWGNARIFFVGSLGVGLSLAPLVLVPHWMAAGLGFLCVMSLGSIMMPTMNVYQMELIAPRWWTSMSGATAMANGLSWSAMSMAGGYVIAAVGYPTLFLTGACLTIAGALLFWACFCVQRGELTRR